MVIVLRTKMKYEAVLGGIGEGGVCRSKESFKDLEAGRQGAT